ncbi:MAG: hypothetical protein COT38_02930 [Candidatus Omnitrophica bacterium CG08_land_8_20_14_0_20_41_16]|nr:MAG: hypothetical protein COT38_02930 [Candidatus Omnitrophica bacterium CG08_land_8_20_14_0_20_41_16]
MNNISASPKHPEIKLLLDENLPGKLRELLFERYDCLIVRKGMTNGEVAKMAIKERRIIVTQDKHFANIVLFPPEMYCGIIRIKIHPPVIKIILKVLENLFAKVTPKDLDKRLVVLEEETFRLK